VDGVRQHFCCTRRRWPLYNLHHTLRSCDGDCAGEQTRVQAVRLAAVLRISSPYRRHQRALLIAQSRDDRTLDAVAPRGSLALLRADVESICGALLLGELPLVFPSFYERRSLSNNDGNAGHESRSSTASEHVFRTPSPTLSPLKPAESGPIKTSVRKKGREHRGNLRISVAHLVTSLRTENVARR
jgi:hypothetical protein